jgi:hypothetical protein
MNGSDIDHLLAASDSDEDDINLDNVDLEVS